VILILFGLAALAPACYSAWVYGQKLSTHWPRLGQSVWTWIGGAIALALGATSCANRLELIFIVMGAVFAPAIGAMAGDWMRQKGAWAGVLFGVNRTGIIAWGAGVGIALALEVGRMETPDYGPLTVRDSPWWYSSSIAGFVASFLYYSLLARLGRERPAVPIGRDDEH
jgi:cytosine permease